MGIPATLSSVPATAPYIQYIASNGQTVFPYPFVITQDSDLVVVINGVTQPTDSGYSLSGVGNSTGGTITFTTGQVANAIVTLYRDVEIERVTQISQNSGFSSTAFNAEFNNIYLILQQLQESQNFSLQVPNTNNPSPVTTLTPARYASTYLTFDQYGNPQPGQLVSQGTITTPILTPFVQPLLTPIEANITTLQQGISDTDQMSNAVAALQAGTTVTIACFGDSTMYGSNPGGAGQVATPPPVMLENTLNAFFGNSAAVVTNNALGGTTINQMLAGTDGSGSTFATKMASSGATIVFCNHGVNDAYGHTPYTTTPAQYRANLLTFIQIVRQYSKTPVLVTPHPVIPTGSFGSLSGYAAAPAWTNAIAQFAQVMREVAQQHGVILVDTNRYLSMLYEMDNTVGGVNQNAPLTWQPDGVHGSQALYYQTGLNLAGGVLDCVADRFTQDQQVISANRPCVMINGTPTYSTSATSRYGVSLTTGSNTIGNTLKIVFRVDGPNLDLSFLHPIFSLFSQQVQIQLDGTVLTNTFNMGSSGYATNFLVDFETQLVRNLAPGFHILIITAEATGYIGFNALRVRKNSKPIMEGTSGTAVGNRQLIWAKQELYNASMTALDQSMPFSTFVDGLTIEWTASMPINSYVGVGGYYGNNSAVGVPQLTVGFGLNASGYATIIEATDAGTYSSTVLDSTNHSGTSILFSASIASPGGVGAVATLFINGSSAGTRTLTQGYQGGLPGASVGSSGSPLIIANLQRIWNY